MNNENSDLIEKIRQQFDSAPYPRVPLEKSPKDDIAALYFHNVVTAYYRRNRQIISPEGKLILDVACGSGYSTLTLAEANPGAAIVGIDISEKSIELARHRLDYHEFGESVEFHVLSLENVSQLGLYFDYINADEVLYLMPDIVASLIALRSVLKPTGILRTNLHSSWQREAFFRAQSLFKLIGLMDENPGVIEIKIVTDFFKSLKKEVNLKQITWKNISDQNTQEEMEEMILMNYLFQGDKGSNILEMLAAIKAADLEFISMVNWKKWDLLQLFSEPDNLPVSLALILSELSLEDEIKLYELINPVHRLLDFWCGKHQKTLAKLPPQDWSDDDWKRAKVYLHPQLKTPAMKTALSQAIELIQPFEISKYLPVTAQESLIESTLAACILLPLLEAPQTIQTLIERWQRIHPLDLNTLEPTTETKAFDVIRQLLTFYEEFGYLLLEC